MARDKMARERGRAVARRVVLGATGVSIAGALGTFGALATRGNDAVATNDKGTMATDGEGAAATDDGDATAYRTIAIPAGETRTFEVTTGQTFENVLLDMTAAGASARIRATGDGWTVRNVAFAGTHPGGHYLFTPSVSADGTATVENIYMGDGQTPRSGDGAIRVDGRTHCGTVEFRNLHVARFVGNGLHGSDPGVLDRGRGGVVNVFDSYFDSNNVANVRLGSLDGRTCRVENCVVTDGRTRPCGVGRAAPGATVSRGIWAWWGPVEVRDSDVGSSPARVEQAPDSGGSRIRSQGTRWGTDADTSRVPAGVPTTPEEAVRGT
ncbi:hypothetical protein [Halorussus salinus]|uniref:hypothetical protein n=1 Tax=Halorussus salinus TaxID=1364935 RepID=UPI0010932DA3|nr:hypothetical protein [Halorussus salinus]